MLSDLLWLTQFVRADGSLDLKAMEEAEQLEADAEGDC